ncbi:MAG: branched-chain amino acid ABC transporter permease [Candidatus Buchananbacteria bacterium CG10_big_fil_rev_8_21_14_0_10_42_9]|uniref:Branched-chain amino acid ABC transporter permease n=1 Tax=Candidatus Buchananbacteria bacterium CG10_big_fil_rev_8_21_14_0_10_42_9 TaxID=1974526 RepID=A0A2H0W307_9BACT|nr:MAG: branched-chain amino acid ABC transporter permease [Candidatus Buchananbacteria bacterium CG10_big_fil_rev_8_21_14_0_10_42_9]
MEFIIQLAIIVSIFAILGISLNLVVGYTGLLSVGHAAFYGIGAYTSAILLADYGVNFFIGLLTGLLLATIIGFLIGLILSKFKDDYFTLVSVGFNVIIFTIFVNWTDVTHGQLGIPGISKPKIIDFVFYSSSRYLFFTLVILGIIYLAAKYITSTSFGRVLKAIREDEEAIKVFGYNVHYYKLTIFVISAGMASVAGSLYASYITFIDPGTFRVFESIVILAIIILGGLANTKGAVLGAILLVIIPELLRFVGFPSSITGQMRQLTYGIILIFLMLYRPQGLMGEYKL